ncbi:hypothetical protein MHA_1579 [Mannheimia haemolytica PHL213]|nr:hypothetical protein MHH_c13900 [Mannheimia haemolytica M42548]EDN74496.1 hypothetical protein MHA_1579 [Mannheimia haemolytica PHL213]
MSFKRLFYQIPGPVGLSIFAKKHNKKTACAVKSHKRSF